MKTSMRKLRFTLVLGLVLLVSASVLGIIKTRKSIKKQQQEIRYITNKLPPVSSKVKSLEVINVTINSQGDSKAEAVIKIRNNSNIAVTGYTVKFGEASVGEDGGITTDDPVVVIEPHGTRDLSIPLSNLEEGVPLILAGAFFADGTEDGDASILKQMHEYRVMGKAKRDAKNGGLRQ